MRIHADAAKWPAGLVSSYAGLHRFRPWHLVRCSSVPEVRQAVAQARRAGLRVRPLGSGHSWSPCLVTDDVSVSVDGLRAIRVDPERRTVTAGAGARLGDVTLALAAHGLCLGSLPFLAEMTVGGAIATASHGTSAHRGTLSDLVRSIELVGADGELWRFGADGETEELKAARASIGLLGVIVGAELEASPIPWVRPGCLDTDLPAMAARLDELAMVHDHLWMHWHLGDDRVEIRFLDLAARDAPGAHPYVVGRNARWTPPGRMIDRVLPGLSDRLRAIRRPVRGAGFASADPGTALRVSMQYALPRRRAAEALELLHRSGFGAANAGRVLELKFLARSDRTLIAPNSGEDVVLFNAYWLLEPGSRFSALHPLEEILRSLGGRPHWGKLHRPPDLAFMAGTFPGWRCFDALRRSLDPTGLFTIFPEELGPERVHPSWHGDGLPAAAFAPAPADAILAGLAP